MLSLPCARTHSRSKDQSRADWERRSRLKRTRGAEEDSKQLLHMNFDVRSWSFRCQPSLPVGLDVTDVQETSMRFKLGAMLGLLLLGKAAEVTIGTDGLGCTGVV